MKKLRAVLFPHSCVSEAHLKKVLSFFEEVTLFQPWFLEKAPPLAKEWPDLITVGKPREDFKPEETFKGVLGEYRQWMMSNYGQGHASFPAADLERLEADSPIWEIRSTIRNPGKPTREEQTREVWKWHLALHLAAEMEEEQQSAVNLLRSIAGRDSPLKGALEDEDVPGMLADLPGVEHENFFSEERSAQILEAWFALFAEKAQGDDPLVTMNPQVMKSVMEIWEEFVPEKEGSRPVRFTLFTPDLSRLALREFLERREALFIEDGRRKAVADVFRNPEANFPRGPDLANTPKSASGYLRWTFASFSHPGKRSIPKRYAFITQLSGKTVGLVDQLETNER